MSLKSDLEEIQDARDNIKSALNANGANVGNDIRTFATGVNAVASVKTVNGVSADSNKNVTIDASDINIDETAETKITMKEAIENIKQPLVIDATNIVFLSENSTSEEIFNAFGGKEVIEDIVKNAYIGNTILGRTYAEWGPPNQAFDLDLINIKVSLDYEPYGEFDLDTYPSISIDLSFELYGTRYRIELYFRRNDSNITINYFGKYIIENVVYLSTSIAGLDKDESTQPEINNALRVSTGDIKTTNYYNNFATFKFGYYDDGTWYPSYRYIEDANKPVLLDAQIISGGPENLYNNKIVVKFIDNDDNILKKLVFTRSNEESDFVISSQEELNLSQITTNKTAIETLDNKIDGVEDRLQGEIDNIEVPEYSVVEATTTQGYAKTYSLTKDGVETGAKINIPKDLVIKSGEVKVVTTPDVPYEGAVVGDKYLDIELNDSTQNHIYIPVKDLVDVYTGVDGTKITVSINGSNQISATIKAGTIELADLVSTLQTKINKIPSSGTIATTDRIPTNLLNSSASGSVRTINSATEDSSYTIGENAFAEGHLTKAEGFASHAEGDLTKAEGFASHAEGEGSESQGESSHAEGYGSIAQGDYSHSEGNCTEATGESSHAEGEFSTAIGQDSHAEGQSTRALGSASHAEGKDTTANGDNQHVQGKYNIEDSNSKYAHIVGNGTADTSRSNAHTIDWNGNGWYQGDVYVGGTNQDTNSKRLVSEATIKQDYYYADGTISPDSALQYMKEAFPSYNLSSVLYIGEPGTDGLAYTSPVYDSSTYYQGSVYLFKYVKSQPMFEDSSGSDYDARTGRNEEYGAFYYGTTNITLNQSASVNVDLAGTNITSAELQYQRPGSYYRTAATLTNPSSGYNTFTFTLTDSYCDNNSIPFRVWLTYSDGRNGAITQSPSNPENQYTIWVSSGGGAACFIGSTLVETQDGPKAIKDIEEGDLVLSVDAIHNAKKEYMPVSKIIEHQVERIYNIKLETDEVLSCTEDHPFYTSLGTVYAKDLNSEISLVNSIGNPVKIKRVTNKKAETSAEKNVYEIKVDKNYNYYVGEAKVLVHNEGSTIKE